jgi:hypothetical protein
MAWAGPAIQGRCSYRRPRSLDIPNDVSLANENVGLESKSTRDNFFVPEVGDHTISDQHEGVFEIVFVKTLMEIAKVE